VSKLLIVRHGHVEGISPERFRGRQDIPLSGIGRRQAGTVATRIADEWHPVAIYTSPLVRCVKTGLAISEACGVRAEPLEVLNDLDYGEWQWKTHDAVAAQWPEELAMWFKAPQSIRFPAGESLQDLSARVAEALRELLLRHPEDTIVIVGHDSTNRVLLLQLLDLPLSAYWRLPQDPCALSEVDVSGDQIRIRRINETYHLVRLAQ
jgi:probable phosphoglycerate mutase